MAALTLALTDHVSRLLEKNIAIYDSTDFKIGMNTGQLSDSLLVLADLVKLDTRGGFFSNGDLVAALKASVGNKAGEAATQANALQAHKPLEEMYLLMAYKIRVMLSHVRYAFDAHSGGTHPLNMLFDLMLEGPSPATPPSDSRKLRRTERLGRRLHPFICFRPADDENDDIAEEVPSVITTYFDGEDATTKLLLSNGEVLKALKYEAGASGFITAHWANSYSMKLEVPNSCIEGDDTKLKPFEHKAVKKRPAGRPKKKPASAMPVLAHAAAEDSPLDVAADGGHG